MEIELPLDGGIAIEIGDQEVGCSDHGTHALAIEAGERLDRFGYGSGAIVHPGNEMAVQVNDGEHGLGSSRS